MLKKLKKLRLIKKDKFLKKKIILFAMMMSPSLAFASDDGNMLDTVLTGLLYLLQSKPAKILCICAIVYVGFKCLKQGEMAKTTAACYVVGFGIIFGAKYIAQQLGITV